MHGYAEHQKERPGYDPAMTTPEPPKWWETHLTDGTRIHVLAHHCEHSPETTHWWLDTPRDGQLQVLALPRDLVERTLAGEALETTPDPRPGEPLFGLRAGGKVVPVAGSSMLTRPDGSGEIGTGTTQGGWQALVRSPDPVVQALALPAKSTWRERPSEPVVPEPRSETVLEDVTA